MGLGTLDTILLRIAKKTSGVFYPVIFYSSQSAARACVQHLHRKYGKAEWVFRICTHTGSDNYTVEACYVPFRGDPLDPTQVEADLDRILEAHG